MAKNDTKKISPLQFYVNRLQVRQNVLNPCLKLGKLTQQYIVDAYCKIEAERLSYIRFNQGKLRVEFDDASWITSIIWQPKKGQSLAT